MKLLLKFIWNLLFVVIGVLLVALSAKDYHAHTFDFWSFFNLILGVFLMGSSTAEIEEMLK